MRLLARSFVCAIIFSTLAACNTPETDRLIKFYTTDFAKELSIAGAGLIGTPIYMAAHFAPKEWKQGKVHGNWCGGEHPPAPVFERYLQKLSHPNSKKLIWADDELRPHDLLDQMCMKHDLCYSIVETRPAQGTRRDCDLNLYWDLRYASSKLSASQLGTAMKIQAWVGGVAPDAETGLNFKTKDIVTKYY